MIGSATYNQKVIKVLKIREMRIENDRLFKRIALQTSFNKRALIKQLQYNMVNLTIKTISMLVLIKKYPTYSDLCYNNIKNV